MKLAYVAGPYQAKTEFELIQNIRNAEEAAIALWQMGYAVICPHKNSSHLGGTCPNETFLNGYLEILQRCDLIVLVKGWEESAGAKDEVIQAGFSDIPEFEWPKDEKRLQEFVKGS